MIKLTSWPYIRQTLLTGSIETDVANFLIINNRSDILEHCTAVSKTSIALAKRFGLDAAIAEAAALLHDISGVMNPEDMIDYACACGWSLDNAERRHPFLLHQRLSSVFAREVFGVVNPTILSAIECHTTLKTDPSDYDMLLFLSDKLSWDQAGTPPFYEIVSEALNCSLAYASLRYINFALDNNMVLVPHQWFLEARNWLEIYCCL